MAEPEGKVGIALAGPSAGRCRGYSEDGADCLSALILDVHEDIVKRSVS